MASVGRGTVLRQLEQLYREGTLGGLGDADLLERYLADRDEIAFEALVNRHGPMVFGLCRRMLREPEDVHDAFQATFLIFVRKASALRDRGLLSNWLYGVAYRVALRARANRSRKRFREAATASPEATVAPEPADLRELGPLLDRELNRLPLKYRSAIVLCHLHEQTHEQAAEAIGCPVGTVRSRLARGRELLRKRLTKLGYGPYAALLRPGVDLPARLLTEPVPPALVAETVRAGLAVGASKTIPAGVAAASVLSLTRGVQTTMTIAQFKWLGLTVLATSVSAGGFIALSHAAGRPQANAQAGNGPFLKNLPDTAEGPIAIPATRPSDLDVANAATQSLPPTRESAAPRGLARGSSSRLADPFGRTEAVDTSNRSIRELEADLRDANDEYRLAWGLHNRSAIPEGRFQAARAKVLRIAASVDGLGDELNDELERLGLERERATAELSRATARRGGPQASAARNHRLNQRKPGIVGEQEVAEAESALLEADADVRVKEIEVKQVDLRATQLKRRLDQISRVKKLAAEYKAFVENPPPLQ